MEARRVSRAAAMLVVGGLGWGSGASAAWAQVPQHSSPVQVSGDGSFVWVANPDSDSVAKINAASDVLVAEYPVGDFPRTLALDDAAGAVYVANQGSQDLTPKLSPETVMRVAQASGTVDATFTTPFGCAPYGVVVNDAAVGGSHVYVSCERRQEILVLDADLTTVLATVPLSWPDPRAMAISGDRSRVYVAHFLTREPGSVAHVSEIDTTLSPPAVVRILEIPPDTTTCETINSGTGVLNLLMGIHLTPPGAPAAVANQLWVGGVNQNNLDKGLFKRDRRFGGHAKPLLCQGGSSDGEPCETDSDCPGGGACGATFEAISRNLYKSSFHDITRFQIAKINLATGQVVGKIDVDEANQGTDFVFSSDGTAAFAVDQFFNSFHIFNTARGQGLNPTTLFASVSRFGPGGAQPSAPCTGGAFLTSSEIPFILAPQAEITPIRVDPLLIGGATAVTGNDYDVTTGGMRAVPDGIGTTPHGVALHPSGQKVYVANFLSRNVSVVKADGFFCPDGSPCQSRLDCNGCVPRLVAVVPSISAPDPLPAPLLDGKILFHTAARDASEPNGIGLANAAPRFNRDDPDVLEPVGAVTSTSHDASYVACISCHPEGGFDGRTWDFSQFGASLRNTMDLRGRASLAPGVCSDDPGQSCSTDSECANGGIGVCANDPSVVCELDVQCGTCEAASPTPGVTCMADRQCGGVCSNDGQVSCTTDGDCGGVCREDGVTPCASDDDCDFGCEIANSCTFFECEPQACTAAKCRPGAATDVPNNVVEPERFFNPMMTVHWNGDRDEVEDFEFTFRSLLGGGDCDGVEHLPDKCIGALVMRSNVARPQEVNPDLGDGNRGLSPRLDHMADYVYSLNSFVRNPNLYGGPSPDAVAGRDIFNSAAVRCAECHDGPSESNQHFTDKRPDPTHPPGAQGGPDGANPFIRHNVGTFNGFDLTDPFEVASEIGQFQNAVLPIPGTRGALVDYLTPTLVDVWNTAPFNHDGAFATLLHGVMPCEASRDDCTQPDAGKNINDQHGTTSNLTPRQLRRLAAFLEAPHGPIGASTAVRVATPFTRLDRGMVRFGSPSMMNDDRFAIRATFLPPPSSQFDVVEQPGPGARPVKVLDEAVVLSLADVDEELVELTIPAGTFVANGSETRFVAQDPVPGIRRMTLRLLASEPGQWRVTIKGRNAEVSLLDKNHITVALEIGDDAFVRTRTFRANAMRTALVVSERRS